MTYGGVNGSMSVVPATATLAMAMLTYRTESNCKVLAFSDKIFDLPVTKEMQLPEVMKIISEVGIKGNFQYMQTTVSC